MMPFKYDPLDFAKPSIRLLRLLKGRDDPIRCELFEVQIAEQVCDTPYEALSYVWGSSSLTHELEVNGKELRITANLHVALSHLRLVEADRILWVDAVCIDQKNHKERGHQVQQMGDIYRQASQVVVWLGEATYEAEVFMTVLQKLQADMESDGSPYRNWVPKYRNKSQRYWYKRWLEEVEHEMWSRHPECLNGHVHEVFSEREMAAARNGLIEILDRSWFRRVWILQEVANASAVMVHCGKLSVPDLYFAIGQEIINFWSRTDITPKLRVEGQSKAVREIMPTRRWAHGSWWGHEGGRTMFSLLKHFGQSEATDQRDIVYALRGISADNKNPSLPAVNYEMSEKGLAIDTSSFIFHRELTSWARLDSISDLVTQLDWLLASSITDQRICVPNANVSRLPGQGIVEITLEILELPFITGHWKMIDKMLSPHTKGHIKFSPKAVIEIYRKCDSFVPDLRELKSRSNISYDEILYAALQNPHRGQQIIEKVWGDDNTREYAAGCGVNVLKLLWGREAPKDDFHPGPVAIHSNCLAALVSQLIGNRRMLTPFDHSWMSQEGESLLGYSIKTGNAWLALKLLVLGADPNMKSEGWTPLMLVAMNPHEGFKEVTMFLIKSRIDLHEVVDGETAMTLAQEYGNTELVRLLSESHHFQESLVRA
ncbi:hypothetical protein CGLO_09382 [Colletotrichum gloeosporioides Cg-14]|uniref:Heterokaryon incompatibility domain-containing protein n=1 Tax=Colletotrichum gloeosporioides (strain Cg-14) TaxID=1237896 RepID=T0LS98_COLGC|nr:hypothetical protein CGLO_09382 [Colletotrichum gloeosporioides Cg-14]